MKKEKKLGIRSYTVETGKYKKEMKGKSLMDVMIKALKKWPPEHPSILTRARLAMPMSKERRKGDAIWHYVDSISLLQKAGFKVKKLKFQK